MNNHEVMGTHVNAQREIQDDLQALSRAFSLPRLNYIDIARQERLANLMLRWPLLAELTRTTRSL